MSSEEINLHLKGCITNSRESQQLIYSSFYNYAMKVCASYTSSREDLAEILNDGFIKIFKKLHNFQPTYADGVVSFKGWLRKIMVRTAIDHFRKNHRQRLVTGLNEVVSQQFFIKEDVTEKMSRKEILNAIQKLSPAYRVVFSLFVLEGLKHEEIAEKLNITTGASKSNLSKARKQLIGILARQNNYRPPIICTILETEMDQ
ncbi:MAG TPA: sigma-70 family RNA polymerase sigma factor [Chitinophagaceae bacterium]|nr:sigma-70 family RNA polymerase sigma factor [Chitinophagaceae bacterium]